MHGSCLQPHACPGTGRTLVQGSQTRTPKMSNARERPFLSSCVTHFKCLCLHVEVLPSLLLPHVLETCPTTHCLLWPTPPSPPRAQPHWGRFKQRWCPSPWLAGGPSACPMGLASSLLSDPPEAAPSKEKNPQSVSSLGCEVVVGMKLLWYTEDIFHLGSRR